MLLCNACYSQKLSDASWHLSLSQYSLCLFCPSNGAGPNIQLTNGGQAPISISHWRPPYRGRLAHLLAPSDSKVKKWKWKRKWKDPTPISISQWRPFIQGAAGTFVAQDLTSEGNPPGNIFEKSLIGIYKERDFLPAVGRDGRGLLSCPLDDLCIDNSAMIIQIPERQGTAMY